MKSPILARLFGMSSRVILFPALLTALFFGSISFVYADATPSTLTSVRLSSDNPNTVLAKVGDTVTVFFTSSRSIDDTPAVSIGGTTAGITVTRYEPPLTWKAERTITESDTTGLIAFTIDFAALAVPGVTVTATTDGSSVTIDKTSPTAALSFSQGTVHFGDSITITATISEPILDSPVLTLSLFGGNALATTTFTKTDSTHYTFTHTVGAGNGTTTVALGAATDLAGNVIASAPTSGADFFVDNIAPLASVSFSRNPARAGDATVISFTTSEPIDAGTPLLVSLSGANTLAATSTARADSTHFSFSYTVGAGDGAATVSVSGAKDTAGNAIVATPTSGGTLTIDNKAPVITVANPDSAPAHSKTVSATASDGTLSQNITTGTLCDGTLSFGAFATTTFSAEADNGKKICYRATDEAGNFAFLFSAPIAGIDLTPPAIVSLSLSPSSGMSKIGDEIALAVIADAAQYTLSFLSINNVATTSMADAGGGRYFATTTVAEGNTDRAAGTVPVAVVLIDSAGNRNATSTGVAANTVAIDAHAPTLVSARTTSTTTIEFSFSEDLNGTTVTNADFSVEGNSLAVPDAFESAAGIVRVTLLSAQTTSATPAVNFIGMVQDLAGNVAPVAGPLTASDGVAPVISETVAVAAYANTATPVDAFTTGEAGALGI